MVDDLSEFRRLICSVLLPRPEFQVAEASDGLEAVKKASVSQPDLIVLDISLPILNGLEVAKRVRNLVPAARILFCSVESDSELVKEALSLGEGYIYKPGLRNDLLPAIEAVLRGEQFVSRNLGLNGRTDAHRHEVQFYSADSVLLECFTRFLATALKADNAAIVLATKSHREGLIQNLKGEGFDVDDAIQKGTYISLDAADMLSTIMVNGVPDLPRFLDGLTGVIASVAKAAKKEHLRIAICGECVGLLCALGNTKAAIQLERVGNDLVKTHNVDIMCAYPLSSFHDAKDVQAFQSICAEHTAVYSQ